MRFIITFILLIIIFRFVAKLLFPPLLNSILKKAAEQMKQNQPPKAAHKPEGTVTIEKDQKNQQGNSTSGSYVDYEEIKS